MSCFACSEKGWRDCNRFRPGVLAVTMLCMNCFRGLPLLRLPSTYSSTTVLVIWQPRFLQKCPKYESLGLRLRTSSSNVQRNCDSDSGDDEDDVVNHAVGLHTQAVV